MHDARRPLLAVILAVILLPGCKRDEDIVTYNAPKPPPSHAPATQEAAASASALAPQPAPEIPGLTYAMPAGWVPLKAHTFEAARFDPAAGDGKTAFTISPLGPGFDYASNLERWQKQVGMTPTPPDKQADLSKETTVAGATAKAFDLTGTTGESYIVVAPRPDATWVFKLTGAADKVQTAKPAAEAFLQSVKFGEAGSTAAAPPMPPPPAAPTAASPSATEMPFTYTAPSSWQLDPQPRPMREATWTAGSGASKVEIYITEPIPASMFDIPSNVNRWRGQVGLPADANISANPTSDVKIGDQQGVMLDFTGPAGADGKPPRRMIVAFAGKDKLWFFKVVGPADAVGQHKTEFEKFLASVEFKPGEQ